MHPKALEAANLTAEINAARTQAKAEIQEAITNHGVRFLVVGNYTICYKILKHDVLEVSTTIRAPNDRPDKTMGRVQALMRFTNGQRILLKKSARDATVKDFLQFTFSNY